MREKLNENPAMQAVVVGVLLLATVFFVMSTMGGHGEAESESGESSTAASTETTVEAPAGLSAALAMVSRASAAHAKPLPHAVMAAWNADKTVVILFVHDGGIDDRLVKDSTESLTSLPQAAVFTVPASRISRYAAITEGVGVN